MMLLMIDNYDSFTYNVVHYLKELGAEVVVKRNDAIDLAAIEKMQPAGIIISPGPGNPSEAGITLSLIAKFAPALPILGICLGHQSLAQAFGGEVTTASQIIHGKTSSIIHNGMGLFTSLADSLTVTRYHSLVVKEDTLPDCLEVNAWTKDGPREVMGIRHLELPLHGVQFHPESILSQDGHLLFYNFLQAIQSSTTTGNHWFPQEALSYFETSKNIQAWLTHDESLTALQRDVSNHYTLSLIEQAWGEAYHDESNFLKLSPQTPTFIRHVRQYCDNKITVIGRTVFPAATYTHFQDQLNNLGNTPLGDLLFTDPHLTRSAFQYAQLYPHHKLYQQYVQFDLAQAWLWMRRSIFTFHGYPLLITEIFIPPLPPMDQLN